MKIKILQIYSYEVPFLNETLRSGIFIKISDEEKNVGWGEIAPLPGWSTETLRDSLQQFEQKKVEIQTIDWTANNYKDELTRLKLFPSVLFGLESALLSLLNPLPLFSISTSALLMGSPTEILRQAQCKSNEGYTSAKLKVSHLNLDEAADLINQLKDQFHLRIDVNRAWSTADSLHFFSQFSQDAFDYVEEPFQNPRDLAQFSHPLAVDESFPTNLSLSELEQLPMLKAFVYKPTLQGGLSNCIDLHQWTKKNGINFILSSAYETDIGLAHIASMAHRLSIKEPIGIGTYDYFNPHFCSSPIRFSPSAHIPISSEIALKDLLLNTQFFEQLENHYTDEGFLAASFDRQS